VEKVAAETLRVYKDALENVKVVKAQNAPFPELLSLMGKISITEDRMTIIPSRVTGRIEKIYFASGEHVTAGQILATLFSPDFVAAKEEFVQSLRQQKGNAKAVPGSSLSADVSDFANLAQMTRKKLESMGLSKEDIHAMELEATQPVDKTAAERDRMSPQSFLMIRAPRTGVLIQKNAVLGNLVNVGDTLFMIGDLNKVWFSGDIFPEDLPKVHKDQEVFINASGVDKPLYGQVSFISPLVDPSTRSIKIRALMDNSTEALKADEYVQGNVILSKKEAIIIPTQAVVREGDDNFVFKRVTESSVETGNASLDFKRVKISLGNEQGSMVAVASGLQSGDEIIGEGALLLSAALNSADNDSAPKK
jgi:Cu(I)/Ag(I) efflux system membrane fusion protein